MTQPNPSSSRKGSTPDSLRGAVPPQDASGDRAVEIPAASSRGKAAGIVRQLQLAGHQAFWVGGCVRDLLLGREPGDYDIATNAVPDQVERLFPKTIAVGRKFGVMVVVEQEEQFQVATFRAESDYQDGRHPSKVSFGDPQADALRRDFTINGLFYDPVCGTVTDWVGGKEDLKAGIIRTIGSPEERFAEDHLRLLRAVRFAAQLGFEMEPQTLAAVRALAPRIQSISAERVRDELVKLFKPGRPLTAPDAAGAADGTGAGRKECTIASRGLKLLHGTGLLVQVLPEIAACIDCQQSPNFHPEGSVFNHLALMLAQLPDDADPLLPWAVLLHDVAKPVTASSDPATGSIHFFGHEKVGAEMAADILTRLRFPKQQVEDVCTAVRHHMQFKDAPQMRKSTLRRMLMRPTFPLELELHRLDCLGSHGRLDVHEFLIAERGSLDRQPELIPPLVTGEDLLALGVRPGPAFGALLGEVRDRQLGEELKTREEALAWLKSRLDRHP